MCALNILLCVCSGYSVVPYALMQVPSPCSDTPATQPSRPSTTQPLPGGVDTSTATLHPQWPHGTRTGNTLLQGDSAATQDTVESGSLRGGEEVKDDKLLKHTESSHELHAASLAPGSVTTKQSVSPSKSDLSRQETKSLYSMDKLPTEEQSISSEGEEFLAKLVTPSKAATKDGVVTFTELFLPPPPIPDMTHILSPTPSNSDASTLAAAEKTKGKATSGQSRKSGAGSVASSRGNTPSPLSPRQGSPRDNRKTMGGSGRRKKSSEKLKQIVQEKLLKPKRDKYCPTGDLVYTPLRTRFLYCKTLDNEGCRCLHNI